MGYIRCNDGNRNWDTTTKLNWSALARKYNVPGRNGGQVLKEYAQRHGVNTYQLDGLEQQKRDRQRKLKMPGGEISVPCAGTMEEVKEVWKRQINEGVSVHSRRRMCPKRGNNTEHTGW